MATGAWYGNSTFNLNTHSTVRLVTAASSKADQVTLTLCSSPLVKGGTIKNPFQVGHYVVIKDVATWANSTTNSSGGDVFYFVKARTDTSITVGRPGTPGGKSLTTLSLNARVKRVDAEGANVSETRELGSLFGWDTDLKATATMCAMQVRTKDILNQFWSNKEIARNYARNYANTLGNWNNYGPQGGYNQTKIVNATMCILYGSSRWNRNCVDGLTGSCRSYTEFTAQELDNKPLGLWQINPTAVTDLAAWNVPPSQLQNLSDLTLTFLSAEYNTRAALWLMWRRIVEGSAPSNEFSATTSNPFRWMPKAQWDPATSKWVDANVRTCWGSNCANCPPYGSTSCNQ